jgi:hypothetical protein
MDHQAPDNTNTATTEGDAILTEAVLGAFRRGQRRDRAYNYNGEASSVIEALDKAGFAIVSPRKTGAEAQNFVFEEIRTALWDAHGRGTRRARFSLGQTYSSLIWSLDEEGFRIVRKVEPVEISISVPPITDEGERRTESMTFDEDRDGWTVTGSADDVARVLELVRKGEAAEKAKLTPSALHEMTVSEAVIDVIHRGPSYAHDVSNMLVTLLAGKKIKTGRTFEITYRHPDRPLEKVTHVEHVQLGGQYFEPPAPFGYSGVVSATLGSQA